jgi:hypothetical protein
MVGVALPPQEMKRVCCYLVLTSSPDVTALRLGSRCLIGEHFVMMTTVPTSSGKKFLSSPKRPGRLWGPSSLLFSGGKSGRDVKLTKPASNVEVQNVWSYISNPLYAFRGARWRSGQGSTLQIGRSRVPFPMVSLEFFSDIILPVELWSWGRLSL